VDRARSTIVAAPRQRFQDIQASLFLIKARIRVPVTGMQVTDVQSLPLTTSDAARNGPVTSNP
jgi:hypothetical protein